MRYLNGGSLGPGSLGSLGGGGGRMAEPGDKSLMSLIRPPAINLSLKFLTRQRDQRIVLPL